jgi:hypothetical protein
MFVRTRIWRIRAKIGRIRVAVFSNQPVFGKFAYSGDGLHSSHVVDFMQDKNFLSAYRFGTLRKPNSSELLTVSADGNKNDIFFRAYVATWAAKQANSLSEDGDFVELGVGGGILAGTIVMYLKLQGDNSPKNFYLFDTFDGIPLNDASSELEVSNMEFLNKMHFEGDYFENIKAKFSDFSFVQIVKGYLPEKLEAIKIERISFCSIDMNNAKAEIASMDYIWPRVVKGGIILLDDYAYGEKFRTQKEAWDDLASKLDFNILTLPTGQGLIIKP